jgi:type I restriction enzyme S subunit
VGNIGFFNERIPYDNIRINSGMVIIRSDPKGILPEYTHQLFKYLKGDFDVFATGSAQPQLPIRDLKEISFILPPLPEQRAIAGTLSSLDDKIDLLHRQNKTLEGMAEALWRKTFVEEADPGWKKGKLGDMIITIESGRRPKGGIDPGLQFGIPSIGAENIIGIGNYEHNKTKYVSEEFYYKMNSGKVQDYDILIYKDGAYIGRKSMFARGFPFKQCCINEHVFILRTKDINTQIFLYFLLDQEELEQLNANSAQPGLNQESMKSFKIFIPDEKYIEKFGIETKGIIDKIFFNSIQIRTLSKIRNTLLPKLMSGEIRIKNVETFIGGLSNVHLCRTEH